MKRLKLIQAGRLVCGVSYTLPSASDPPRQRTQKQKASTAARERLNARFSYQKLERTLAANFDDGDLFLTLTYDDERLPENREMAVRKVRRFLSLLRAARKKRGCALRYIYVTEGNFPGGRLHHHVVLNGTGEDYEEIRRLWTYGTNVLSKTLKFTPESSYDDLASYLTKEPREYGHPAVGEHTWQPSMGMAKPQVATQNIPDYVTLSAPPGAFILACEGPVKNGYGEYSWIKYLLPEKGESGVPRAKAKRKRQRRKK